MRLEDLFEMAPRDIEPLDWHDLNDDDKNMAFYRECCSKKYKWKEKLKELSSNAILYRFKSEYFCLDSKLKKVTYYLKYQVGNNGILGQYVWQSLVWTDPQARIYLTGIPTEVFFKQLLPKFHTVITDSEQTWQGKRFWEYRIADAFDADLHVYFFDFSNRNLVELKNYSDLKKFQLQYDIWGNSTKHEMKRIVISDKKLEK